MQSTMVSMNFKFFFTMLFSLVLISCTSQLLKDAEGVKLTSYKYNAKILSAYRSDDGANIYVCIKLSDEYKYNDSNKLFTLPLNKSDGVKQIKINNKKHYFYYSREYNLENECVVTKNKIDIIRFEIHSDSLSYYDKTNQSYINKILKERKDALYVAIEKNKSVQIGYISSEPINNMSNIIHAPINDIFIQDTTKVRKPYLYLGVPVTVAADVVVGGMAVMVVSGMIFGMVVAGP